MEVIQTAADPPNQGKISFEESGWTRNSRQALTKTVNPKRTGSRETGRLRSRYSAASLTILDNEGLYLHKQPITNTSYLASAELLERFCLSLLGREVTA